MARKNEFGRYILSAGEIGAYTVCPESWRLKNVVRIKAEVSSSEIAGRKLHKEWANKFDEASFLDKRVRFVAALCAAAFILFLLLNSR